MRKCRRLRNRSRKSGRKKIIMKKFVVKRRIRQRDEDKAKGLKKERTFTRMRTREELVE
jgi:hypothetical protein